MRIGIVGVNLVGLVMIVGCGKSDSDLPPLHPVNGVVKMKGAPVGKGALTVRAEADNPTVVVVATLAPDGKFDLSTILVKDKGGKKHPGAPAGTYMLSYAVESEEQLPPIELKNAFTVEAGQSNEWSVELTDKK